MVLQITANPGQVMNHLDADVAKRRRRADAGQLEQLRGADGAGRQHHLATGGGVHRPAVTPKIDAHHAPVANYQAGRLRLGHHRQIGAPARRLQKTFGGAPAHTLLLVNLKIANPLVGAAVEIGHLGDTGFLGGVGEGVEDFPADRDILDPPFATLAMQFVGAWCEILMHFEKRQDIIPTPTDIA